MGVDVSQSQTYKFRNILFFLTMQYCHSIQNSSNNVNQYIISPIKVILLYKLILLASYQIFKDLCMLSVFS